MYKTKKKTTKSEKSLKIIEENHHEDNNDDFTHNIDLGKRGEDAAKKFLCSKGYEIIETN